MTHSDLAALRGEPSYVWRAGQERRLQMIAQWAALRDATVLVDGCGLGTYASQFRRRYTPKVEAFDIEIDRTITAREDTPHALVAAAEQIPYPSNFFDTVLSHEVLEHVLDDRLAVQEMVRVLKPGGRIVIFVPNRWYPFETHGHYWHGEYHFGNTPLINYLPNGLRNKLAPHVRAYTKRSLRKLFAGQPVKIITHRRIYGGYDNIIARLGTAGQLIRDLLYHFEGTPLDTYGLSHLLVVEKTALS
ncbi:MAG: methyltransferase domain-containing protein [Chitinophagaceae bacterium]|nr:methyltransferase domain-containing protein [Anaerolineae bacterium]